MEKKTETPRTRNRGWGFFGTCVSNGHEDPEAAWDEAVAILTDLKGRFRLEPEVACALLDSTWGRHLADQLLGAGGDDGPTFDFLVDELAQDRRWMKSTLEITRAIVLAHADDGR
ncbi:MAG: hypothetical protein KAY32_09665 [Candidatus Eisenbacteria sp.]|nr:hypothetical protein [Candidatus Eisenbacteria bacterium]